MYGSGIQELIMICVVCSSSPSGGGVSDGSTDHEEAQGARFRGSLHLESVHSGGTSCSGWRYWRVCRDCASIRHSGRWRIQRRGVHPSCRHHHKKNHHHHRKLLLFVPGQSATARQQQQQQQQQQQCQPTVWQT